MFYYSSKIIWLFLTPSSLIGFIFLLALLTAWHFKSLSRKLFLCASFLFVTLGFLPIGYNIVHFWETRYPYPVQLPSKVDGVIVLGGMIETELSAAHGIHSLNDSSDRLSHFIALSSQFPDAKLVFTGGSGDWTRPDEKEAHYARTLFEALGLAEGEILFEDASRNTYENALFSKKLVQPAEGETWLLVTSAFHMPRSMAVFKTQAWDVIAVPVDFKTGKNYKFFPDEINVLNNLRLMDIGMKEAVGLAAYKLAGKI